MQGCINGYGERCGNANLMTVLADLKLKMGIDCIEEEARAADRGLELRQRGRQLSPNPQAPYVGASAFAHKAGYHVAAIVKNEDAYQHVPPASVGNDSACWSPSFRVSATSCQAAGAGDRHSTERDETRELLRRSR